MQATQTTVKNEITLKGSVEIVTEFFGYAINKYECAMAKARFSAV